MRVLVASLLAFALLLPAVAYPVDAYPPDVAIPPVSAELEAQVRDFLDRFVDPHKTPAQQAALFTDDAEYYEHGIVGRAAIENDVKRYIRHWPERHYRVRDIQYITPDPGADRVFVSYVIDFQVTNGSRSVAGQAAYGAVIVDLEGAPKVEWIKEKVTRRKPAATTD